MENYNEDGEGFGYKSTDDCEEVEEISSSGHKLVGQRIFIR